MLHIKSVCVYCGSSNSSNPEFNDHADKLGKLIAESGLTLVYGGGNPGLMGRVSNACVSAKGKTIGIIPNHIRSMEIQNDNLTELHIVDNMHVRKQMMAERSDAFVILPGGFGTLDETFEILTWKYLGTHNLPIIIANINGFWNPLIDLINHMHKNGFVRDSHMSTFVVANSIDEVMDIIKNTKISERKFNFKRT